MKLIILSSTALLIPISAWAERVELTCSNPRRDYSVSYDAQSRRLTLDDETEYTVLAVEETKAGRVLAGSTVNNGPTFRLHLDKKPRFEFYVDGDLNQTDRCKKS